MSDINDEYNELREKFFAFLLRRPCTHKQAQEYLSRQKINDDVIASLMNEAEDNGLIDDLVFAKLFAEGHLSWGNLKIAYELGMRHVSRENINIALEEVDDEVSRACELADSWRDAGADERKIKSRLLGRGFTNKSANYAAKQSCKSMI